MFVILKSAELRPRKQSVDELKSILGKDTISVNGNDIFGCEKLIFPLATRGFFALHSEYVVLKDWNYHLNREFGS